MRKKDTIIKALSLSIGLAISFVLIATVHFHLSYDSKLKDIDRIYQITPIYHYVGQEEPTKYNRIPGAIAPAFQRYVPGIEQATRTTGMFSNNKYVTETKNILSGGLVLADTSFFKVFESQILIGDPIKILGQSGSALVSRKFAEKIVGNNKDSLINIIGQKLYNEDEPNFVFHIDGVFEDFPKNSSFNYLDILLSMETYPKESTENWLGNDRYEGWIKLSKGLDPNSLHQPIRQMLEEHLPVPLAEVEKSIKIAWELAPMSNYHASSKWIKIEIILLSITAFLLILISVMNYILISVSAMVRRSHEVGMRKCYGAEKINIYNLLFKETAISVLIALAFIVIIIFAIKPIVENMLELEFSYIFSPQTFLLLGAVLVLIFFISAVIPGYLYSRIPINIVLKNYNVSKRRWKLILLLFQFTISIILVIFLSIMYAQYNKAIRGEMGYSYEKLLCFDARVANEIQTQTCIDAIKQLPGVIAVERASNIPMFGCSGNIVMSPDGNKDLFNFADQYEATPGILDMLEVEMLEGRAPRTQFEMAVSRSFVEKIKEYKDFDDWQGAIVGQSIIISEHGTMTVTGVYEDYLLGTLDNLDTRPSIRVGLNPDPTKNYIPFTFIKVDKVTIEIINQIENIVNEIVKQKKIEVFSYKTILRDAYDLHKKIRNTILAGSIFSIIIAFFGLIGYIRDETQRRSKEMAIRKINGATTGEIMRIFIFDVLKLILIAVVIGDIAAYLLANAWLQLFAVRINITPLFLLLGDAFIIVITLIAVVFNTLKISRANPVVSLKTE